MDGILRLIHVRGSIFLRNDKGHGFFRGISRLIHSGQGQGVLPGLHHLRLQGVWQFNGFSVQSRGKFHLPAEGIRCPGKDLHIPVGLSLRQIGGDLRSGIVHHHLDGGRPGSNGVRSIFQFPGVQIHSQGIETGLLQLEGNVQDLHLGGAVAHADLCLRGYFSHIAGLIRMPVFLCVRDGADAVDRSVGNRAQGHAVRQHQPDILQHKIIVVFYIMFQIVGLIAGVESDGDLPGFRVEIVLVHIVGVGPPRIVGAFVKDSQHILPDGHGVLKEHVCLTGVKGDAGVTVDRGNRLAADLFSVDLQAAAGSDDGLCAGKELALFHIQLVPLFRSILIFHLFRFCGHCLISVADFKIIFIVLFSGEIHPGDLPGKHIPQASQQIIHFIGVRMAVPYIETHGFYCCIPGYRFHLKDQATAVAEGFRRLIRQHRSRRCLRQFRRVIRLLAGLYRSRCGRFLIGSHGAGEGAIRVLILEGNGSVRGGVVRPVHVVGDIIRHILHIGGDLHSSGAGVGHAPAGDLHQMGFVQIRAEFGVEIFSGQSVVAAVLDPEYQGIPGFQNPALRSLPPYHIAVVPVVGVIVIQLVIFQIYIPVGIVIELDKLIGIRAVYIGAVRHQLCDGKCRGLASVHRTLIGLKNRALSGGNGCVDAVGNCDLILEFLPTDSFQLLVGKAGLEHAFRIGHGKGGRCFFCSFLVQPQFRAEDPLGQAGSAHGHGPGIPRMNHGGSIRLHRRRLRHRREGILPLNGLIPIQGARGFLMIIGH